MYIKSKKRYLLPLMIATCAGSALAIGAIFADTVETLAIGIIGTCLALCGFFLSGLVCWTVIDQPRLTALGVSGIVVSICGAVLCTAWVWNIGSVGDSVVCTKIAFSLMVLAVALADYALLLRTTPASHLEGVCVGLTLACVALLAVFSLAVIWMSLIQNDVCFQILCALVVLAILGTVLTALLKKRQTLPSSPHTPPPPAHSPPSTPPPVADLSP